jgi:hypothetical protein
MVRDFHWLGEFLTRCDPTDTKPLLEIPLLSRSASRRELLEGLVELLVQNTVFPGFGPV